MDGVLFDTERMYMECWREAAEPRGLKNVDEISKACIGRTLQGTKEVFEAAKAEQGIDVSFEELHEDCSRRFKEKEEREGLPEKPGVHEILEYLKENRIPTALASSTRRTAVMEHLDRAGITSYFQKIICGDMVEHGKPAPDIYLKACEELGRCTRTGTGGGGFLQRYPVRLCGRLIYCDGAGPAAAHRRDSCAGRQKV